LYLTGKDNFKEDGKGFFKTNGTRKQEGGAILICDKADFNAKLENTKKSFHPDNGNNPSRGYSNCKDIYIYNYIYCI
jgi:hypothetical protein